MQAQLQKTPPPRQLRSRHCISVARAPPPSSQSTARNTSPHTQSTARTVRRAPAKGEPTRRRSNTSTASSVPPSSRPSGTWRCRCRRRRPPENDCRGRNVGYPTPPAQIRTWSLNHPAPTSGLDGKSRGRPRMQNPQRRPEGCRQYADPVPSEAILLRALPQGAQPHPLEATHKPVEGPEAGWHCVVTQPSAHDPTKPFGDLVDVVMHSPAQFGLDALQGPIDALGRRPQARFRLRSQRRRLKLVQRARQLCREAAGKQRPCLVGVRAIPARNAGIPPTRLAPVGAVADKTTATPGVLGTAIKLCLSPGLCGNVVLAGQRQIPK